MDWPWVPEAVSVMYMLIKVRKRTVAVHGVNVDVGSVALGGEAIITNVNPGTLNIEVLNVQRVKEVSVLGKSSGVGGASSADDVLEGDVLG
jgi:hypothetical protein